MTIEDRQQARVVVLGGWGTTGEATVRWLTKGRGFAQVVVADSNVPKARGLAPELGADRVEAVELDVGDRAAVLSALRGAQVIINEVGPYYRHGRNLLEAAIEVGVHYVDINDEADVTFEVLDSGERAG